MRKFDIMAIADGGSSVFMSAKEAIRAKVMATDPKFLADMGSASEDGEEECSYILEICDNVGVININGGLTCDDSWYNRYFGVTSYNEIRRAIAEALGKKVGCILFNIASPGGEVAGMSDTANLISSLPVPTISFSSGQMASAAYFLGIQSDYVYADSFADVGSVGVVISVYDYTKYNEKLGIGVERFRSGDLKGSGNPNFSLTPKEKAYIQEKVDMYSSMFFQIVSEGRGMPLDMLDKLGITSGRTYIGAQALQVNLIDGLQTLDQSMLKAYDLASKYIDKQAYSSIQYR